MRNAEKSKRMMQIAQLVRPGAFVADVGTDHAYLPIYLIAAGIAREAIAADVAKGPLDRAASHIKKNGLQDQIRVICSDGLQNLPRSAVEDIIIAGMGGELIFDILQKGGWTDKDKRFILQPMTGEAYLRKMLWKTGYEIDGEYAVAEGRHVYTVMQVRYTGATRDVDDYACAVGKIEKKLGDGERYLLREKKRAADKQLNAVHTGDEAMRHYWHMAQEKIEKLLEGQK